MSEESEEDILDSLSKNELVSLLKEASNRDPDMAQKVELALASKKGGNVLASQIKKKISALKRSNKFYCYNAAPILDRKLEDLRSAIIDDLGALDCNAAIDCAEQLLDIHPQILESVDDSAEIVWPVLQHVVSGLATLYARLPGLDFRALAEKVFHCDTNQNYNTYDYVIRDFCPTLGEIGMNHLEKLYREYLETTAEDGGRNDGFKQFKVSHALLEMADARQDVDQYIAVLKEFEKLDGRKYEDVIRRLLGAKRPQEALNLLDSPDNKQQNLKLRSEALQALGRCEEAQACRLEDFLSYPTMTLYEELLEHDDNPAALKEKIFSELPVKAGKNSILAFLMEARELDHAAQLVLDNIQDWDGGHYYTLEPAAKTLSSDNPLAATVLYRALVDDILARAKSRYYHHAVRYILALEQLANKIADWYSIANHLEYIQKIKEAHKHKRALWGRLSDAGWQ